MASTLRQLEPAARSGGRTPGVDARLYERARDRLARLCRIMAILFGLGLALTAVMGGFSRLTGAQVALNAVGNGGLLAFSVWLMRAARDGRRAPRRVADLGAVYEIAIALFISVGTTEYVYAKTGAVPVVSLASSLIVLFPLVLPLPRARTLITAILAAAMAPVGLALLILLGEVYANPLDFLVISVVPALSVLMAMLGFQVVHQLSMDLSAARHMGRYRLEDRLGAGGMGEVWRARHARLARPAAIKLIRQEALGARGPEHVARVLERFEREAQVTASLRSPHTVELYDYGTASDGTVYYVMELLEGFDLETLVQRFGPQPPARVVGLLAQICDSLAEAHERGLVHRDIKPANLHLARLGLTEDFVKVLDFGLVALQPERRPADAGVSVEGVPVGTPSYMAPEAVQGAPGLDERADLYSLGCVAWWLLTGRPVFEGKPMAVMVAHCNTPPPPLAPLGVAVPPALEALIMACLAKQPAERPPSARALQRSLAALSLSGWSPAEAAAWWQRHAPETGEMSLPPVAISAGLADTVPASSTTA
ncbi:MAG: protein kinase [Myxococcales bacterium]|nr:protein kinase [Myxococcales bacterium]